MSPTTSYASSSNAYDVQSEKVFPSEVKSSSSSACPWALRHAPSTLTGSLRDQMARRGAGSPLCRASSASSSAVSTQARKSSRSVMRQACCPTPICHETAVLDAGQVFEVLRSVHECAHRHDDAAP